MVGVLLLCYYTWEYTTRGATRTRSVLLLADTINVRGFAVYDFLRNIETIEYNTFRHIMFGAMRLYVTGVRHRLSARVVSGKCGSGSSRSSSSRSSGGNGQSQNLFVRVKAGGVSTCCCATRNKNSSNHFRTISHICAFILFLSATVRIVSISWCGVRIRLHNLQHAKGTWEVYWGPTSTAHLAHFCHAILSFHELTRRYTVSHCAGDLQRQGKEQDMALLDDLDEEEKKR